MPVPCNRPKGPRCPLPLLRLARRLLPHALLIHLFLPVPYLLILLFWVFQQRHELRLVKITPTHARTQARTHTHIQHRPSPRRLPQTPEAHLWAVPRPIASPLINTPRPSPGLHAQYPGLMSGFPHNILHSQEDAPPRLAPIAQRGGPSSEGASVANPGSTSEAAAPAYNDTTVASPSREDYASSQFQYRPSSSSGDLAYRRDSGGSSAGSRPSTTASLNPTMQQLSTAERLPLSTTLPPLRSVMGIGRPASASESAGSPMSAANTLLSTSAWEQNRPRAASASSFTATGTHRGTYLSGRYDRSILGRSALVSRSS